MNSYKAIYKAILRALALKSVLMLIATQVQAMTLQEATNQGLKNNPQLQASEAAYKEAQWKTVESIGDYLPKISLSALHDFDVRDQVFVFNGVPVAEPAPRTIFDAEARLNIFSGFRGMYSLRSASAGEEAAQLKYQNTKLSVENQIQLKFYQALAAQILAEVAEANVKNLTNHYQRSKNLLEEGELTKVDVLKVKVRLEQAIPERQSAYDNVYLAKKSLAEVIGSDVEDIELKGDLPAPASDFLDKAKGLTVATRLDYQALIKTTESFDDLHKATESHWYPQVSLVGGWQNYNNMDFSVGGNNFKDAYNIGVQVTWNIFDGGIDYAKQSQAFYQKVQAEKNLHKTALGAPNELEFWKRRYQYNLALYTAQQHAVEANQESIKLYTSQLRVGTVTNTDLLDAELELDHSKVSLVQSQVNAIEAMLNVELSVGRRIE